MQDCHVGNPAGHAKFGMAPQPDEIAHAKLGGLGRVQLCAPSSHLRCSTNEDWSIPDLEYRQASANHKDLEFFMRMIKRTFEICLVNSSPFYEKGQVAQDLQMTFS